MPDLGTRQGEGHTGQGRIRRVVARSAILLAVCLGALFRIGNAVAPTVLVGYDGEHRYLPTARNLLAGNGFSRSTAFPFLPNDFEVPGYPVFLAAVFRLLGDSTKAVALVQLVAEAMTVYLLVLIARNLALPSPFCFLVGGMAWVSPWLPSMASAIATEQLAVFQVTVLCYLLSRSFVAPPRDLPKLWTIAGLTMGLGVLLRPDAYVLGTILPLAVVASANGVSYRRRMSLFTMYALAAGFVLVPWMLRTHRLFGRIEPPGWQQFVQDRTPWRRWTRTWIDDFDTLRYFWGAGIVPSYPTEFPAAKIPDDAEREMANRALAIARERGAWEGEPDTIIRNLAEAAEVRSSLRQRVLVPVKRMLSAWIRLPCYTRWPDAWRRTLQRATYAWWACLSTAALAGTAVVLRSWRRAFLFLPALIGARLVMPLTSALGLEPRYLYQALPAVYILAAVGVGCVLSVAHLPSFPPWGRPARKGL